MKKWHYPFLAFLIIGTIVILHQSKPVYRTNEGLIFGTSYKVTYLYNEELDDDIKNTLNLVDASLSMFNTGSTISRINRNEETQTDTLFLHVFSLADSISQETNGAFDITVAPAVNAWGFGFKNGQNVDDAVVDSLKELVGYHKIHLENGIIAKDDPRIMLDCSAIAKGFGCDMVGRLMDSKHVDNYMIEIGGEVVVKGKSPRKDNWNIGICKPVDDTLDIHNELQTILSLSNCAMATSGNYRNFYYKDGKKYAHTIDPKACRPVAHTLLSVTVIAKDCATADAFATSMMVMGLDSAKALCNRLNNLEAYFIFQDSDGSLDTAYTPGFDKYVKE